MSAGGVRILQAGAFQPLLDPQDRGLAYGDGLFETILVHEGQPVWWSAHWQRLQRGAQALGLPLPDESDLLAACAQLLHAAPQRCVLKLICTRGSAGRSYAPPPEAQPTCILSWHPLPRVVGPVDLRWCALRWAIQPRLAGIKHLNRLEQVLARAEWQDPAIFDGLVLDLRERVVSATSANVFALVGGQWRTPPLHDCGITGLMRAWVLQHADAAVEAELDVTALESAEALFVCNAVRGILEVRRLGDRVWPGHPAVADLRRRLSAAEPAFALQEI